MTATVNSNLLIELTKALGDSLKEAQRLGIRAQQFENVNSQLQKELQETKIELEVLKQKQKILAPFLEENKVLQNEQKAVEQKASMPQDTVYTTYAEKQKLFKSALTANNARMVQFKKDISHFIDSRKRLEEFKEFVANPNSRCRLGSEYEISLPEADSEISEMKKSLRMDPQDLLDIAQLLEHLKIMCTDLEVLIDVAIMND